MQIKITLLLILTCISSVAFAQNNLDAEKTKKLDGLFNKLKTQNESLKQDIPPSQEDEEKIIAELKAKYAICENKYIPKTPTEVQDTFNIAAFKGTAEEKENLYLQNISKNPHSPDMQSAYIGHLLGQQKLEQGQAYLTQALQQFPNDPKLRFYIDQYEFVRANPQLDKTSIQIKLSKAVTNYNSAALNCRKGS